MSLFARAPLAEGPDRARSRRGTVGAVLLLVAFTLGIVLAVVPSPYVIETPGPVYNTLGSVNQGNGSVPLISIPSQNTYPTEGSLDLLTVSVIGNRSNLPSWVEVGIAWLDASKAVQPVDAVYSPTLSPAQQDAAAKVQMVNSQQEAVAAALGKLGYDIPRTVSVKQLQAGSPAAAGLVVGDVIETINGAKVTDLTQLRDAVAANGTGKPAQLGIRRAGATSTVGVTPVTENGRTIIGVSIGIEYSFPFPVTIQLPDVGGPSAGLMFALGIYDKLTPGALTGGKQIAGTGTIDARGTVGPIGGIRQKLYGARSAGATFFLAPKDNCDSVTGNVPGGLQVIAVGTLDDALAALSVISAGAETSSLPSCPAG